MRLGSKRLLSHCLVRLLRMDGKRITYFPGLDGLRFFAALAVIISHVELLKSAFKLPNTWDHPIIFELGGLGVSFFFVLSGFLITYLLLVEQEKKGDISLKNFYLRRVLRIWPLFYFVFILGFFVLPNFPELSISYLQRGFEENYWGQFLTYLFILPNLGYAIYDLAVPHIGQSWSIGVEEQFYLFWPILARYSKSLLKHMIWFFVLLVAFKVATVFAYTAAPGQEWLAILKRFLAMTKMENMCIGGIGAYALFHGKSSWISWLYRKEVQVLSFVLIPVLIYITPEFLQDGIHIVYSVMFLAIIMNIATNPKSLVKVKSKLLAYLGRISYGLYMYHMMLIPMVVVFVKSYLIDFGNSFLHGVLIYVGSVGLTILVAGLSYRFFEKPFLSLKKKFAVIR